PQTKDCQDQTKECQERSREMSVYKRGKGKFYWCNFWFEGKHYQVSTYQSNIRQARKVEDAYYDNVVNGRPLRGEQKKDVPTLAEFAEVFKDYITVRRAKKPQTIRFYLSKLDRLLAFKPLATCRLDQIDEDLIERYVQRRVQSVRAATVNREL